MDKFPAWFEKKLTLLFCIFVIVFCCYFVDQFFFFFFLLYNVIYCHVIGFNFLIENYIIDIIFFFVDFLCDQFLLNVITALFQKGSCFTIPHTSVNHV